jgi:hypothetical protein
MSDGKLVCRSGRYEVGVHDLTARTHDGLVILCVTVRAALGSGSFVKAGIKR